MCGCFTSGQLLIWDTREKTPSLQETECDKSVQWTMDCSETDMVQLSSGGDIQFRDLGGGKKKKRREDTAFLVEDHKTCTNSSHKRP